MLALPSVPVASSQRDEKSLLLKKQHENKS